MPHKKESCVTYTCELRTFHVAVQSRQDIFLMQIYVSFYTFSNKEQRFFWSADYFGGVGLVGRVGCVGRIFSGKYLYSKKIAGKNVGDFFGDPSAVIKIFKVSCATDSYEMCFCGTL